MQLDFEQQENNTLKMHCRITTTISAIGTLEKFCMSTKRPKIYMVKNLTDCNALSSLENVQAQEIAHSLSPSKIVMIFYPKEENYIYMSPYFLTCKLLTRL